MNDSSPKSEAAIERPTSTGRSNRMVGWLILGVVAGSLAAIGIVLGGKALFGPHPPPAAYDPPLFVEESIAAGIDHTYDGDFTYFVGGGVAVFDCNDDGRPDLYLAGGIGPAALYRNESPIAGELRFTHLPEPSTDLNRVTGAYPLDIDGDARIDLAVLRLGGNVLLRGLGDCRFERPMRPGCSTEATFGRWRSAPNGKVRPNGQLWRLATTSP